MKLIKMMIGLMLFCSNPISSATSRPLLSSRVTPSAPPMPPQMEQKLAIISANEQELAQIRKEMEQWDQEQWFKERFPNYKRIIEQIDQLRGKSELRFLLPETMQTFADMVVEIRQQGEKQKMADQAEISHSKEEIKQLFPHKLLKTEFESEYQELMAESNTTKHQIKQFVEKVRQGRANVFFQ